MKISGILFPHSLFTNTTSTDMERIRTSPKDFFLHVAAIITLYISSYALLQLTFQLVNYLFPDKLAVYIDPYATAIRWSIALLVIIFPVYILCMWFLNREMARNPEKRDIGIRKWLLYLTLFISGTIVVGDLIALINTFLGGEITTRFMLKVSAVLIVAALIFGYYIFDLRSSGRGDRRHYRIFMGAALTLVLAVLVGGFLVMGSPGTQRIKRFDATRVENLKNIQWEVINYWQQRQVLPPDLDALTNSIGGWIAPTDPDTDESYNYEVLGPRTFKLCATFSLPSHGLSESTDALPPYPVRDIKEISVGSTEWNWQHDAGRACFERTIDPKVYPPHKY